MKDNQFKSESEFELVKELNDGVWIANRKTDPTGERFLARRIDGFDKLYWAILGGQSLKADDRKFLALKDLLYDFNQGATIAQILNHENVISIVGHIHREPFIASQPNITSEDYLVWDYCDASNLAAVFKNYPHDGNPAYYLPESLCWHVLRALARATAHLHDGKRASRAKGKDAENHLVSFKGTDSDWLPILHRAIVAENVNFQHPRGIETYGPCKLGNFSRAAVVSHTDNLSITSRSGWTPFQEIWSNWNEEVDKVPITDRPYTQEDELFAVGALVFRMMTGTLPQYECSWCFCSHIEHCGPMCPGAECRGEETGDGECMYGGCKHMPEQDCSDGTSRWRNCPHGCDRPQVNIDHWLMRSRYSRFLRKTVQGFLIYDPKEELQAGPFWKKAQELEKAYQAWKTETEEGREFQDVDDDVAARKKPGEEGEEEEEEEAEAEGEDEEELSVNDDDMHDY